METEAFIDRLFDYAEACGLKEYQVSYAKNENSDIQVFNQKILKQSNNTLMILNFSVRINGKVGRFTTESDLSAPSRTDRGGSRQVGIY